jgi:hypothetical protein
MRYLARASLIAVLLLPVLRSSANAQSLATFEEQPVHALLPAGPALTSALDDGRFRLSRAISDRVHLLRSDGSERLLAKSRVRPALQKPADDSAMDGLAIGALAGAGAMAGLTAVMYARCDAGCEAPAEGPMFLASMGLGAGVGAAAGWIIDKLHKGTRRVLP